MRPATRDVAAFGLVAFLIIGSYEIARASAESLFLAAHGDALLPWAWVAVGPASIFAVELYGRAAARLSLGRVLGLASLVSASLLALLLAALSADLPGAAFVLYVWKDVYVVVLVEAFWARANGRFETAQAKWIYGLFTALGSAAGFLAGASVGALAARLGTEGALGLLVPWLGALGLALVLGARDPAGSRSATRARARGGLAEGVRVVARSRYLVPLLALVLTSQLVITLVDWIFNHAVQARFPGTDERTGVIGTVYAAINLGAIALQLGTGLVVRALGVGGVLGSIPLVVGGVLLGHLLTPVWAFAAAAKVASKVFDYSLFRAAKELLYIPLSAAERSQGKAVVDMLTYRSAKAGAAALVGLLVAVAPASAVVIAALGLLGAWVALALALGRRYEKTDSASPPSA